MAFFGTIIIILSMFISTSAVAVDYSVSDNEILIPEKLLPLNTIKANSEVQLRRVQKMMSSNRDQTYGLLNQLKLLSQSTN